MDLIVAEHAGFCFGVRRAMDRVLALARAEQAGGIYTLGELIHNPEAVRELERQGVRAVSASEEAPDGSLIVIRTHGVGREETDKLAAGRLRVADATCPFVKRIHALASEAGARGIPVLVVGDELHPEVRGILGWAHGMGRAIGDAQAAAELAPLDEALIVAQTTIPRALFDAVCAQLRTRIAHPTIHMTICPATQERQAEAVAIASAVDVMLVVGGAHSSNTRKLYELCASLCPRTHLVETVRDLDRVQWRARDRIGITAGASTPDGTFKEVVARMNDIENQEQVELTKSSESTTESDFMADVEKTLVQIRPGQTVTGTVVQITEDEVCVNVGYKADGLVKRSDLSSVDVKIGDEIEVEVVKVNDGEGNVLLSQRNLVSRKSWEAVVAAYESGEFVKGVGKDSVKGGLIASVMGIRAFIPASLLSLHYVEKIEEFTGQEMDLKIIELDKSKKRIVASRKAVLQEEEKKRKQQIWNELREGEIVKGIVRRLTSFGAFVDIGGVDGLVHVTDLSWGRVGQPSDVVSVNQEIDVKILKLDPERERISLSYKQTMPRPWDVAGEKYLADTIVTGKVVRIVPYGAFVELEPGLDGMVHISQCALTRVAKVEDAVQVGEVVRVKILSVDTEAKRISLSIREALADDALDSVSEDTEMLGDAFAIGDADLAPEDFSFDAPATEDAAAEEAAPENFE